MHERVFLLELNGLTLDLLRQRADALPNFKRLLDTGASGALSTTSPPTPPALYGTLLTGVNPARHGVFDFFNFPTGGYARVPYGSDLLRAPTFLERLSRAGRRVGVLNSLLMNPLPEVEGFVVAGDEGVGEEAFARPAGVLERLREDGYRVPFGASYAPGREEAFLAHVLRSLEMRRRALRRLFTEEPWDFGMMSLFELGELLHALWRFVDPDHPAHGGAAPELAGAGDPLVPALRVVDSVLGDILELTGPRGLVLAAAAWGHAPVHARVLLNTALARAGHLRFRRAPLTQAKRLALDAGLSPATVERLAHRLNVYKLFHYGLQRGTRAAVKGRFFLSLDDVDWPRTRAVALGSFGQIFMNVAGRRPRGAIGASDYRRERAALRRELEGLRHPDTGAPLVERVLVREDLYAGERLDDAPDLVVVCRPGHVGHDGFASRRRLVSPTPAGLSSDHDGTGFLLAAGRGVGRRAIAARLEDIAPTVLRAFGIEPDGADLDGRPLPLFEAAAATGAGTAAAPATGAP